MRRIGGNELEEMHLLGRGEQHPTFMSVTRRQLDARGRYMIQMVQAWGATALLGDAVREIGCDAGDGKRPPRPTKQEIVMLAAEMVEATFEEAQRRGWIVETDPAEEWGA